FGGPSAVPRSVSCLEPFHAAFWQDTGNSIRILVTDAAFEKVRHGDDAGVWMEPDSGKRNPIHIEQVQKNERVEQITNIGGNHQSRYRAAAMPSRARNDPAGR